MNNSEQERLGSFFEDPVFAEKCRNIHKLFTDRLAAFTAFDANLSPTYAADWLAVIEEFEMHPTDETMRDEGQVVTEKIIKQREICWDFADDLEYYAKRAFPNHKRKMKEFGFIKSKTARERGGIKLVKNLYAMGLVGVDYTTELTAVGMPGTLLPNLEHAVDKLGELEIGEEYQLRLRIRATGKRIELWNSSYKYYRRIHDAAQVIYRDKPETKQMFDMG